MTDGLGAVTAFIINILLLDWLAVIFSWRRVECLTKPLAMMMIILWTLTAAGWHVDSMLLLLIFGQGFGLAGDVFLLLSRRWFLWGLGSFFFGHLFYLSILGRHLIRIVNDSDLSDIWMWWILLSCVVWMVLLLVFYRVVAPKSPRLTMQLAMWVPIQFYGWILISLVTLSILVSFSKPGFTASLVFLPAGSFLFFLSDSLLAFDRFKRKMPKIRVWVMMTYHLAQISLAGGFLTLLGYSWI